MSMKERGSDRVDELANKTQKQAGKKQKPFPSCLLVSALPPEGVSHMEVCPPTPVNVIKEPSQTESTLI